MKFLSILVFTIIIFHSAGAQNYYIFPDTGWSQTQLFGIHNGLGWDQYPEEFTYTQDSIINGHNYKIISNGIDLYFLRQENGKVIWRRNINELILYDFSLNIGDTVGSGLNTVIVKKKIEGPPGDSLWYIEIEIDKLHPDTIKWLEGVGDLYSGLLKLSFPDAGYSHICTRNRLNQTIYSNILSPADCNCDYIHGQDIDKDGYRVHVPFSKTIELTPNDWPPYVIQSDKVRKCDTLEIINHTGLSMTFLNGETGEYIQEDSVTNNYQNFFFYHLEQFKSILITHQSVDIYYNITVLECIDDDCNDFDSTIHPLQFEIHYDLLDNDCNALTLDDDVDMDGFDLAVDCNDANSLVNPNQVEIIYNGIDDDCNPQTPDDDFDQDGFSLDEDCDDMNSLIFPGALEIPNNEIDEDCDGEDLLTSLSVPENEGIRVYPNPVIDIFYLHILDNKTFGNDIYIINSIGQLVVRKPIVQNGDNLKFYCRHLPPGPYFLQLVMKDGRTSFIRFLKI